MKKKLSLIILVIMIIVSCSSGPAGREATPFLLQHDFDGDGVNDKIEYDFSGGAHCCYKITVYLSSTKTWYLYPFELDGGYLYGLDNSNPEQFCIKDFDHDGLPEIYMRINTYNGETFQIPDEWRVKYNIQTNYIIIQYENNTLSVKDFRQKEATQK